MSADSKGFLKTSLLKRGHNGALCHGHFLGERSLGGEVVDRGHLSFIVVRVGGIPVDRVRRGTGRRGVSLSPVGFFLLVSFANNPSASNLRSSLQVGFAFWPNCKEISWTWNHSRSVDSVQGMEAGGIARQASSTESSTAGWGEPLP